VLKFPTLSKLPKLSPRYLGPYRITEKVSKIAYRLDLPSSLKIHNVLYSGNLYPYLGDKSGVTFQPVQWEELKLIASELPEDRVTTEVTSDEKGLNVANASEESVENKFEDEIGYYC
jgi:hypothetical protein